MKPSEDRRGPRGTQVRINEQIRARVVLVIDSDGTALGQMAIADALKAARDRSLDLVEVSPLAQPPVCRILDYGRQQYEQSRREREARKNQKTVTLKQVRVRPKTDPHDLETKQRSIIKWLQEGDHVQLVLRMRGREQAHPDWGRKVLLELASKVGEVARVERDVLSEGRQMTLILAPSSTPAKKPARQAAPATEKIAAEPVPPVAAAKPEA
ncbi:MAG: translation initiation factor IF-3 [Chloroflexota bacterium]